MKTARDSQAVPEPSIGSLYSLLSHPLTFSISFITYRGVPGAARETLLHVEPPAALVPAAQIPVIFLS